MKKIKVMTVFGTRPEAIKMAPLVLELESNEKIESITCITAQHRQMLDQVLNVFQIKPDYDLDLMKDKQTLIDITSGVVEKIDKVIKNVKPDIILVHGDTTTTFAASLAAFYNQVKIGHVEAGLRTNNLYSPFPEEANRQMVGVLADYHFTPTEKSYSNLIREGKNKENIFITGNTAIDALKFTIKEDYSSEIFNWLGDDKLILLTAHRRENVGEPMRNIFKAIKKLVQANEGIKVVYPIHMNPLIRELAHEVLKNDERIKIIDPLQVIDFHNFMNRSYMILTDSGGIQEEAPSLGKPVLVLRDTTERPEGVEANTLKLVGTDENSIFDTATLLLNNKEEYEKMSHASNPYGDGNAAKKIVDILITKFEGYNE